MKIDRLLSIVITLLNKERVQAAELAERYEVSVRTIYRDLETINSAGIPIVSYQGNNGGYGIMKEYSIDKQYLTLKEMLAIAYALKGIDSVKSNMSVPDTLGKIENLIPKEKKEEFRTKLETLVIDMEPWAVRNDISDKKALIEDAIESRNVIEFNYKSGKGEESLRKIEPMTLVYKGLSWYIYGYCRDKNDYRIFKIIRMKNITTTNDKFIRREQRYSFDYEAINKGKEKVRIRFSEKVREKVEEYFSFGEFFSDKEGYFIVETDLMDEEWFFPVIYSYGEMAEVIEPIYVRERIKNKVEKILNLYQT